MREVKLDVKQSFYNNGQIYYEEYRLNGNLHNENGPAIRGWHENGQLRSEGYWLNGNLHNENGPAYREWYNNGQIRFEHYFLNDKELSKEEFETRSNPCAGKKVIVDGKEYVLTPL